MILPPMPGVVITWPQLPCQAWDVTILDADTERDWSSVTLNVTVVVQPGHPVYADLLMFTDAEGNPMAHVGPTQLTPDGKSYATGTFRFRVVEMRLKASP